jgi:hypothetical protein
MRKARRLESIKDVAQIVSLLAVPLVVAWIGSRVQQSLSESSVRKEYVQMALSILRDEPAKQDSSLREWAISVFVSNSPVDVPDSMKKQLRELKLKGEWFATFEDKFSVLTPKHIECRDAPDQIVNWLVEHFADRFSRCPDGKLGAQAGPQEGTKYYAVPPARTSDAK